MKRRQPKWMAGVVLAGVWCMPGAPALAGDAHAGHGVPVVTAPQAAAEEAATSAASTAPEHAHHHHPMPASPAAAPDPHAGHVAPAAPPPGHDAHPGPALPVPTPEEVRAAFPELAPHAHMKAPLYTLALVDRLEARDSAGDRALAWDIRLQAGTSFDRLVLATEGERRDGETGEARHELYWRHAFSRWWESRLGLRHDAGEGPGRDWVGAGIEGLAPYFVELSATVYAGEGGRSGLTLEAEYDMRISNRLILQPRLELNAYGEDDLQMGRAAGLAESEAGLRLRYELRREFAPYLGVDWVRKLGDTGDLAAAGGERRGEARAVAGLRLWY